MRKQLELLRAAMKANGMDWYYIPTDDFHASEYVGDYFKSRAWMSGFTGSAGTLLVSADWAGLWTDGRYFLQAAAQLEGSGIELMKMGEPGVPTIAEYLTAHAARDVLGYDGRTVSVSRHRQLKVCVEKVVTDKDLVGEIWTDRPAMSAAPVWELPLSSCGQSRADKLRQIRRTMRHKSADVLVLSSLMDICWLLNIRGGDVACTPVVLSFAMLTQDDCTLFVNRAAISDALAAALQADGVILKPYDGIYRAISALPSGIRLQMDLNTVNSAILHAVPRNVVVLDDEDPTLLPKACKNPVEVANFRTAHVKDGIAVTRLMYWLKKNAGKLPMDELSVADHLEELRREQPGYLGQSFHPIIGYGPHGAIIHYSATEETNIPLEPRSLLLADTGGHYEEGTTDITRTFALGPTTDEEKRCFTLVLKGHLALGAARFLKGTSGLALDVLARQPLWQEAMNYNHGTGHGVGYLLSVHEGPQSFRYRAVGKNADLQPGMIISNEPGLYIEGKFGVRHEDLVVVREDVVNEYGTFYCLDTLTMVPWDLDAVDASLLNDREKELLNAYHAKVRDAIRGSLPEEEALWLDEATRAI